MDIATFSQCGNTVPIQVTCTHSSKVSPPPYMVGMAEIALDKETGSVEILDYVAVVDCGTVVNTNLATVQTEGGLVQGIGLALSEDFEDLNHDTTLKNCGIPYPKDAPDDIELHLMKHIVQVVLTVRLVVVRLHWMLHILQS